MHTNYKSKDPDRNYPNKASKDNLTYISFNAGLPSIN